MLLGYYVKMISSLMFNSLFFEDSFGVGEGEYVDFGIG